jgi:hypothetical protein
MSIDRRGFLRSAALLSGVALVGFRAPDLSRAQARAVLTVDGRRYGLRYTDFRDGRTLTTVRELEGARRWAFSYPTRGRVGTEATLRLGRQEYRVSALRDGSFRTDFPGASSGPVEGDTPQPLLFRGLFTGLAIVIAAIRGDKVEIEGSNGSKITINGDGKAEPASTQGSDGGGSSGGGDGSSQSSGYRAEPGMEEEPGVWY